MNCEWSFGDNLLFWNGKQWHKCTLLMSWFSRDWHMISYQNINNLLRKQWTVPNVLLHSRMFWDSRKLSLEYFEDFNECSEWLTIDNICSWKNGLDLTYLPNNLQQNQPQTSRITVCYPFSMNTLKYTQMYLHGINWVDNSCCFSACFHLQLI